MIVKKPLNKLGRNLNSLRVIPKPIANTMHNGEMLEVFLFKSRADQDVWRAEEVSYWEGQAALSRGRKVQCNTEITVRDYQIGTS